VPVKLYRAARKERVRLHYVHQAQGRDEAVHVSSPEPTGSAALQAPARASKDPEDQPTRTEPLTIPPHVSRVRQTLVTTGDEKTVTRDEVQRGYEVEPDRYLVFNPEELKVLRRRTSATMEIVRSVHLSEIDPVFLETSYYVVPDRGGEKAYAILFAALQA